jgi:pyridoxal 5'-phosphate synthase pdxS subunit
MLTLFLGVPTADPASSSRRTRPSSRAVVLATTHYNDPVKLAEICTGLGEAMRGEGKLGAAAGKEMTADRGY